MEICTPGSLVWAAIIQLCVMEKHKTCCTADVDQRFFLSSMLFMKSMDQSPLFILMLMSTHGTHTDMLVVSRSRLTLTTGHSFGTRTRKVS